MRLLRGLLMLGLASCAADTPRPPVAVAPDVLTPTDSVIALRGGRIATAVALGLAERLQTRLASDGAAGAIDFCSKMALELTDSIAAAVGDAASVKRVSLRMRNPDNAPDSLERAALAYYDSISSAGGELPSYHLQGTEHELRYYRPLVLQPFCEQCHGDPSRMEPAVLEMLQQRYPADAATGYRAGEWRGLIRVALPRH